MATLLDVAEARALIRTSKSDEDLGDLIAREEEEIIRRFGAHYATGVTVQETHLGDGPNLFLRRAAQSVSALTEDAVAVTSTEYRLWAGQGRIERLVGEWAGLCVVTFVPVDDTGKRKQAVIDLLRLTLERTAMRTESVGGEYSYTAPEWERERSRIYKRMGFVLV